MGRIENSSEEFPLQLLSGHEYGHIMLEFVVFRSANKLKGLHSELFLSAGEERGDRKFLNNERHTQITQCCLLRKDIC